jgi:hypothetical protein
LGLSRIRSAGRSSGSIELTLPPALQPFTGIGCRILVRDSLQPEIVLHPDLSEARSALEQLWQLLCVALGRSELIDSFKSSTFTFTLLPPRHWRRGLPLGYADLAAVVRADQNGAALDEEAHARVLSVVAAELGRLMDLQPAFAVGFGDAVAYVVTQVPAGLGSDFERSMTAGLCRQVQLEAPRSALEEGFWLACEPALRRIYQQFCAWQDTPSEYEAARQRWYRALQCESVPPCAEARPRVAS